MNKENNISAFKKLMGESLITNSQNQKIIQEELNVSEIKIGLISGFCVWSGYTFGIGKRVLEELSSKLAANEISHFLLDCDFVSDEVQEKLFKSNRWGYFESCWIENGEILKRYKYKTELELFLEFVKKRLEQLNEYFKNKELKAFNLDSEKEDLGIDNEAFNSKHEAIILSKSKYRNEFLYNLMEYQSEGNYYLFEDDQVTIYDATTPTYLSSCYVKLKIDRNNKKKARS